MKMVNRFISNNEVTVYFIVTILLTWFLWFPAILIKNFSEVFALPYSFFITIGIFIPSVTGFIFAYRSGGKVEVISLIKSMINVDIKAKWLLYIFLVLPGVSAVSLMIFTLLGGALPQMQFAPLFIPIAFIYILVLMGPLGEEAGWRGFALKKMLKTTSPLIAAIQLGIVWSAWHLPLFFINGTTQNTLTEFGYIQAILGYFLYTIMISVLITLLFIMSNGNVFGSILFHTIGNLSLGVFPLIFSQIGALIILLVLSVVTTCFAISYKKDMSLIVE